MKYCHIQKPLTVILEYIESDQCLPFKSPFSVSDAKQKNFLESGMKKFKKKTSFSLASVSVSKKMYYAL